MDFSEIAKKNTDRVLVITDDVKSVQNLVTQYVFNGHKVFNVEVKRPVDLAIDVIRYDNASKCKVLGVTIIDDIKGAILIEKIVRDNLDVFTFCPKESLCKKTALEILDNVNMIRLNHPNDKYFEDEKENNDIGKKIKEINKLCDLYEKELVKRNLYDEVLIYKNAIGLLDKNSIKIDEVISSNVNIYSMYFNDNKHDLYNDFIERIEASRNTKIETLDFGVDNNVSGNTFNFKKCYGIYTEVYEVLKDIVNNKYKFGEVEILYSNDIYVPYIKTIFGENKIKVNFISNYDAKGNDYVKLVYDILSFAKKDFTYKELKNVCFNRLINIKNIGNIYLNNIENIGFYIEQYLSFINAPTDIEEVAAYKEFLNNLIAIFNTDTYDPFKIYDGVLAFADKYTNNVQDKNIIKSRLINLKSNIELHDAQDELNSAIDIIIEELDNLKYIDVESDNEITAAKLSGYKIYDRHNFYIMGLSSKHYEISTTESPIFLDDERKRYFPNCKNVRIKSDSPVISDRLILNTVKAFKNSIVNISMPFYDVLEHMTLAESTLYNTLIDEFGKVSDKRVINEEIISEYPNIVKEDYKFDKNRFLNSIVLDDDKGEEKDDSENKDELINIDDKKIDIWFSKSSLDMFKDCPLRYHYAKEARLSEENYITPDVSEWLNAAEKGTFAHKVLEEYANNYLIDKEVSEDIDLDAFNKLFEECAKWMKDIHPVYNKSDAEQYLSDAKNYILNYLKKLHIELGSKGNKWKVFKTELGFGGGDGDEFIKDYKVNDKTFSIHYNGFIDRVDCYTDDNGKIHVRLIDYKTGKKANFGVDATTQQHIYAMYVSKDYIVDEFRYEFIFDEAEDNVVVVNKEDLSDPVEKFELDDKLYNVFINKDYMLSDFAVYDEKGNEANACRFCSYKDICLKRIK